MRIKISKIVYEVYNFSTIDYYITETRRKTCVELHPCFGNLKQAMHELRESRTFQGIPITNKNYPTLNTRYTSTGGILSDDFPAEQVIT